MPVQDLGLGTSPQESRLADLMQQSTVSSTAPGMVAAHGAFPANSLPASTPSGKVCPPASSPLDNMTAGTSSPASAQAAAARSTAKEQTEPYNNQPDSEIAPTGTTAGRLTSPT